MDRFSDSCFAKFLVFFCLVLGTTNAGKGYLPNHKELIFHYEADVRTGALQPRVQASQFVMHSDVHVQAHDGYAIVQFADVKYQAYNGPLEWNEKSQTEELPLPEGASELSHPFKIKFNDGKIDAVYFEKSDPTWSRNMKQALASLMQLPAVERFTMHPDQIVSMEEEDTIYGNCTMAYRVEHPEDMTMITKTFNPMDCDGFKTHFFSNVRLDVKPDEGGDELELMTKVHFHLKKHGDSHILDEAHSTGMLLMRPHTMNAETFYRLNKISMKLFKEEDINSEIVVHDEEEVLSLVFGCYYNEMFGFHVVDLEKGYKVLSEAVDKMTENHVAKEESVNDIRFLEFFFSLRPSSEEFLEKLHEKILQGTSQKDESIRNLFYEYVPHIGTKQSLSFIRNVIKNKKVSDKVAAEMLQNYPLDMRMTYEGLLEEFEDIISLTGAQGPKVHHAAVLSFGTLVNTVCKATGKCKEETIDKYVNQFFTKFTESSDHVEKMVYLDAVSNIALGSAAKHIRSVITGEITKDVEIRFNALWASRDILSDPNMSKEWIHVLRKIVVNKSEKLELRCAALSSLMFKMKIPSIINYVSAYMIEEKHDVHFYHFFYTSLKTLAENDMNGIFPANVIHAAQRMMQVVPKPKFHPYTGSSLYQTNHRNIKESIYVTKTANTRTGLPKYITMGLFETVFKSFLKHTEVYIKIEGLSDLIKSRVVKAVEHAKNLPEVEKVLEKAAASQHDPVPFSIDLVKKLNDKVIFVKHYDQDNVSHLKDTVSVLLDDLKESVLSNRQFMTHPSLLEFLIPSESGMPSFLGIGSFHLFSSRGKYSFDTDQASFSFRIRNNFHWLHENFIENAVYNPMTKVWHGVARNGRTNAHVPINIDVGLNFKDLNLKLAVNRLEEGVDFGMNMYVTTGTYFYNVDHDAENFLHKSCPKCENYIPTSKGSDEKKSVVLFDHECDTTGRHMTLKVYDCERDVTIPKAMKLLKEFFSDKAMSHIDSGLFKILAGGKNFINYFLFAPNTGNCGIMFVDSAGKEHSPTSMVFTLSFMEKPKVGVFGMDEVDAKIKTVLSFVDSNNKVLRQWDFENHYTSSVENIHAKLHVNGVRSVAGEKNFQFCMDLTKEASSKLDKGYSDWDVINDHIVKEMKFVSGKPVGEGCPSDGPMVTMTKVGTVTDEQKQLLKEDHWGCETHKDAEKWGDEMPQVPECWDTLREVTTARHYKYNMTMENVPKFSKFFDYYLDFIKAKDFIYYRPIAGEKTEEGHFEGDITFSATKPELGYTFYSPKGAMKFEHLPSRLHEYKLDNVRYPDLSVAIFEHFGRFCMISTKDVTTFDRDHHDHEFGEEWTLVTGVKHGMAVFVKKEGPSSLAVKVVHHSEVVEINSNGMFLNGNHVEDSALENVIHHEVEDHMVYRLWKMGSERMVYCREFPLLIRRTNHAVTMDTLPFRRANTLGMCGNLNDDPYDDDHTVYSL